MKSLAKNLVAEMCACGWAFALPAAQISKTISCNCRGVKTRGGPPDPERMRNINNSRQTSRWCAERASEIAGSPRIVNLERSAGGDVW